MFEFVDAIEIGNGRLTDFENDIQNEKELLKALKDGRFAAVKAD